MPITDGSTEEPRGFSPGRRLVGSLRPPGSKSIAQRALFCAALAEGTTRLVGVPAGDDVEACVGCVRALGAEVREIGAAELEVVGVGPRAITAGAVLEVGESGTLARFATGVLGLLGSRAETSQVRASGSLRARHSGPLVAALERTGAQLESASDTGTWPLTIRGPEAPSATIVLEHPLSSQEVSALWIASAASRVPTAVRVVGLSPSVPYLELTRDALRVFGCEVHGERVEGRLRAPRAPLAIEPDASSAAVALAAGCLSGGEVRIDGLGYSSHQGDVRIVEHLARFGCDAGAEADALWARGTPSKSTELDLAGEPDLAPVLAVVAAAAARACGKPSVLRGLAALPRKESDRLSGLADGLARAGFAVRVDGDALAIGPPGESSPDPLLLDPHGDHRMAFAWSLVGLVRANVRVASPGCVAKSWPDYWEAVGSLRSEE